MIANRSKDTGPEMAVRRLIHARGLRYRIHMRPLADARRTADIVFTRQRIAIFIDGCFWHACPEHFVMPHANTHYWAPKIARNQRRDHDIDEALTKAGWAVIRAWEHEPPEAVADLIERTIASAR
jgi:DNA mismatch endonuclease (patch repair protein)